MLGLARGWGDLDVHSSIAAFAGSIPGVNAPRSLHESLIELLPDAVLALDVEVGRFVLANAADERLARLQRISRVETCDGPLGPRLDLARSTGTPQSV